MLKWNDVYYYSYDENGYRVAKKVIHIEEALTEEDSNLKIYPIEDESSLGDLVVDFFACTGPDGNPIKSDNNQNNIHFHYNNWHMYVNLHYFYSNDDVSETQMNVVRERTGEHELGMC